MKRFFVMLYAVNFLSCAAAQKTGEKVLYCAATHAPQYFEKVKNCVRIANTTKGVYLMKVRTAQRSKKTYRSSRTAWKDVAEKTGWTKEEVKAAHTPTHWLWIYTGG